MHRTLRRLHSQQLCVPFRTFLRLVTDSRPGIMSKVGLEIVVFGRRCSA